MTKEKVLELIVQYKDLVDESKLPILKNALEKADDETYERLLMVKTYNLTNVTLFSIFLGGVSGDRFYLGDYGVAIGKLLFGCFTFGIWNLIDIISCNHLKRVINIKFKIRHYCKMIPQLTLVVG